MHFLTRVHCAINNPRMSHRPAVVLFGMDSSELSKPNQCTDRISFEVGRVFSNLNFGNTP